MILLAVYLAFWRKSEPRLRIAEYTQLTHSGDAGNVVATDGARLYLSGSLGSAGQVTVSGGEIEPFTKLPPRSLIADVSPDGTTLLHISYETSLTSAAPLYSVKVLGGSPRYLGVVACPQKPCTSNLE